MMKEKILHTTNFSNVHSVAHLSHNKERDATALRLARKFVRPNTSTIMFVATRHHVEVGSCVRGEGCKIC